MLGSALSRLPGLFRCPTGEVQVLRNLDSKVHQNRSHLAQLDVRSREIIEFSRTSTQIKPFFNRVVSRCLRFGHSDTPGDSKKGLLLSANIVIFGGESGVSPHFSKSSRWRLKVAVKVDRI